MSLPALWETQVWPPDQEDLLEKGMATHSSILGAFLVTQMVKNLPAVRRPRFNQEDPLEKRMVTHSSILAWRIPWTEKPGGLRSMWSQRVRKTEWLTLSFYLDGLQGSVNVWNRLHTFVYVNNLVSEHQVCKWSLSKSQRKLPLEQLKAYILKSWISSNSMTLIMNKSLHYFTSSSPYL